MISEDRPLCIQLNWVTSSKACYSEAFYGYGKWTLAEEPYSESQFDWEACTAEWKKNDSGFRVKCMEPAVWYVRIANVGLMGSQHAFCEYHKPRVVENT